MNWLLPLVITAQLADISTTVVGLHKGCQERLSPVKTTTGVLVMKGGGLGVFLTLYPTMRREHPKMTKVILLGLLASGAGATAWNLHTLPNC